MRKLLYPVTVHEYTLTYFIWVLPINILQHQGTAMDDIITLDREGRRGGGGNG